MLGSNNYLGLTGDERVMQGARDALDALRHRPDRLAPAQRHASTCTSSSSASSPSGWAPRSAIVFTTGHQANVGTLGTILGARRHGDRRLRRPRLDPRRLPALAGQAAPVPPQPPRQAREDARARRRATAAACSSSSTACSRWRATSRRCREIVELCERYGARLMVDEAHGAGVLGARGAGRVRAASASRTDVDLRMGTFSKSLASCGGFIAGPHEVIDFLRISAPRLPVHRLRRARRGRRRAGGAADHPLRRGPRAVRARARQRALPERRPATSSASRSSRHGDLRARRSCPCWSGTTGRPVLLWRALYDAGVYVNVALHPAVPPGGALLRTSVMATHDRRRSTARSTPSPRSRRPSRPSTARCRPPPTD